MARTRLDAGLRTLFKIQKLPHSRNKKCKFIRTSAHSRSLYGCESSHVDENMLKQYTSHVLKTSGTHNQMHCRSVVFGLYADRYDLDPYIAIYYRRFTMYRKMNEKHLYLSDVVSQIYCKYQSSSYPGTIIEQSHLGTVEPTPVPGGLGRASHKHELSPCGPI
eukprot:12427694-Karenia_brevis.AAC.1